MNILVILMHPWLLSAAGGVLIGLSAVLLMGVLGRIAGISGIASGLVAGTGGRGWRIAFIVGLVAGPWLRLWWQGDSGIGAPRVSWPWLALAGLLVGFGTRLGGGCTSGHGVYGIARLSPRSLLATVVFVLTGMVTVLVVRHLPGVGA